MTLPAVRPCSVCYEPTRNYGPGMALRDAETDEPHWCAQQPVPYMQLCALCDELKQSDQPHVCQPPVVSQQLAADERPGSLL